MASFRERAEAELKGTSVEQVQARKSSSNGSFRERAMAELSRSSQQANTAYRSQLRRKRLHAEEQERKRAAQNKVQMQKIGRQTTRQRIDTGENESQLGYGNYLSYKGVDQREIPWKEMTENQIAKAKQAATEKQASKTHVRNLGDTILDTANAGAGGGFVTGVAKTADFLANLLPNAEAKIMGQENPEGTFTGQLLKPLTDATQKFSDWTQAETEASAQRAREDVGDSKIGQLAVELGSGVVGAIPNAVLAMMTGGGSLAGEVGATLAPQAAGASSTILNSVKNVVSNPSFQMSYIQTLGGAYQDAKDAGASELDATAAAFISSAANALVEVGGGLETLPGELKAEDLSTFDKSLKWVTSALDEGKEELVQGVISALTNKAAANNDTPYFSTENENAVINPARMGKEFGMGAAVGGILSGAQMLGTEAISRRANRAGANAGANADGGSNAQANTNSTDNNVLPVDRNAGRNADSAVADNVTATDPLEFAIQETMKPSKERQTVDEALQRTADWMNGKEETIASETIAAPPETGTGRSDAMAGTADTVSQTHEDVKRKFEKFLMEHKGKPSFDQYSEFGNSLTPEEIDVFNSILDEAESENKIKFNGSGAPSHPKPDSHHIDQRNMVDVKDRNVNAFSFDNPELQPFIREGLQILAEDIDRSSPGERIYLGIDPTPGQGTVHRWTGNKRKTTPEIAELKDVYRMSWDGINEAVTKLYDDSGKENNAGSKRIELLVDDILTNGHKTLAGNTYEPNQAYIDAKLKINGAAEYIDYEPSSALDDLFEDMDASREQNQHSNNDMGAKKSDFPHETKKSKGNTTPDFEALHNVPEDARTDPNYIAATEAETNHNAKLRLDQDYDGEVEELRRKAAWSAEEMSMGRMILEDLWAEADDSGDWSAYQDWAKVFEAHKQEGGRALQNLAQINRRSGAGIVQEAANILGDSATRKGTDTNAVMNKVSDAAKRFDTARTSNDVDGLVRLIKDTAAERNTGYRIRKDGTQKQSKHLNWALDRIAGYAKSGKLAGNVDSNLQIDASNIQNPDVAFRFLQDFASTGILNIAADTQKVSMGTKLMALRRSGMLSKLSTTMRNLVSNSGFNVVDTIARDISVPLDMLLSNFTKTRSVAMDYGYLSKAARQGSLDNIAMASLETSLDVNGRGNSGKYASGGMRTFKANGNIVERFLSNLEALQGYEMYVTDEMSKGRTQAGVQEGINKLYDRRKIKASDDSLRNAGHQEADYRTFQNDSKLAKTTLKTRDAFNTLHVGDVGVGDVLMPFAQVPANLADRAIDYSPAGLAKTTGKMVDAISKAKRGEFTAADQAAVVQSLGRNITGTVMIGIAAALAANGLVRVVNPGGEDENKDKAALEKMQGQNGTQWNLSATKRKLEGGDPTWKSGDELISIAFMEPMNAQLTIGALLAEDMEQEGQLTAETALKDSFAGSLAAILDLPMMDTIGDAIDAYNYSGKDRIGDKLLDAGSTLAANEVASLIPNWMKGVRQGLDPYQRDMYSEDDVWGQVADQYQAVFGDRNELPIKQDSFGRDMTNEGGVRNFLNANVLPGYLTTYKGNELTDEITRLAEETGSNAIFPSRKAPDELTVDGEKLPLSYEERQQYQKVYGNMDEAIRTGLMASDAYSKLSSEERFKAHQFSEDYAKQIAASKVNKDYDVENWVEELQGKSEAEIVEAVLYKTFSSIADGKEYSSKYEGMADLVDQDKLSDAMAITMMPEKMQTAYQDVARKGGVSVDEWLDMYAYAYPSGKTETGGTDNEKIRTAALEYIDKQNWGDSKKTAAASAIFQYLTDTIPLQRDIPYDWALKQGDSGLAVVENSMSKTQKQNYEKYIKGHLDDEKMELYLDAYKFKGTAKNIYEEDGETVKKSAMEQVIEHIDGLEGLSNREKIRIFLGLNYSEKNIPYWWYY